jgi:hypothetical protein
MTFNTTFGVIVAALSLALPILTLTWDIFKKEKKSNQ